jgi:hypothetical protein
MARVRWFMALVTSLVLLSSWLVGPSEANQQTWCTKHGWSKVRLMSDNLGFPDDAEQAVRQQGYWNTSGDNGCYQRGLFDLTYLKQQNKNYSYCTTEGLWGNSYGYDLIWCKYWPRSTWWYQDQGGRQRYVEFVPETAGKWYWWDPNPYGMPPAGNTELHTEFKIRYDGEFDKKCWHKYKLPPLTYIACSGGRGDGTGEY